MVRFALAVLSLGSAVASNREACKRQPQSWVQLEGKNPGAGIEGYDDLKPFVKIYKDGFFQLECVKDSMYEFGDKHGDNKHSYRVGPTSNVSIVHYTEKVPKEDRKEMTPGVCFEFCRGIENMGFFGIFNGRDCYCTPYFKPSASDSSACDAVCPGDTTKMCGGKTKSQIFSMHMCEDTDEEVKAIQKASSEIRGKLEDLTKAMLKESEMAEKDANMMQKSFGNAGDPDASAMFQEAKIWAGKNLDAGNDGMDMCKQLKKAEGALNKAFKGKDLSKYDNLKKVEDGIKSLTKLIDTATSTFQENSAMWNVTQPPAGRGAKGVLKLYYPIMYFVDKKYQAVSTTCSGELVAKPTLNYSPDECAAACDSLMGKCIGFAYYEARAGICFLYSKFKTAQYYTGCGEIEEDFLQTAKFLGPPKKKAPLKSKAPFKAKCVAKLQMFEGTSLKPNIKCPTDNCLKELTKANRCFKRR